MRRVVIAGGSGQIGTLLLKHFMASGDKIVVLTRSAKDLVRRWRTA